MPSKRLIARLPNHIERPPAEKFDELVIKVFRGSCGAVAKRPSRKRRASE